MTYFTRIRKNGQRTRKKVQQYPTANCTTIIRETVSRVQDFKSMGWM